MQRNGKIVCADVFAKRKQRAMPSQIFDGRFYSLVDFDLFDAGIALDVKNAIGNEQVVIKFLRAANIQNRISLAIKLPDFFQRQTDSWRVGQIARAKRPAIFEIEVARNLAKNLRRVIEPVSYFKGLRVIGETR